jgi:ABC-2 type transport system permease protein
MIRIRQVLAVAGLFLRRFLPHPLNIVNTLLLPFVIAFIFGTADSRAVSQLPIGAVVARGNTPAAAFVARLDNEPGVVIHSFANARDLQTAVARSEVVAGVVVGPQGSVAVLGDAKEPLFAAADAMVHSVAARPLGRASPVATTSLSTTGAARTSGVPRAAAGMLVFWVFVNALIASSVVAEDKHSGVLNRIASAPVPATAVVTGDVLARFVICFTQALIVAALSSLVFGTTWGALVPFIVLMFVMALTAAAASVLVGVLLRRPGPEAATTAAALAALFGLLGGCFWALSNVPTPLRVAGRFTPQEWVLSAIDNLVARGAGLADIAGSIAVLFGFAAAFLALAAFGLRRSTVATRGAG